MKSIPLTQGRFALVDDCDFDFINQWHWYVQKAPNTNVCYAVRQQNKKRVYMHCQILGIKGVDHRDRNGLNNQRNNLRPASNAQNCMNRGLQSNATGFKGVAKYKGKFCAHIKQNGKQRHLGFFTTAQEAAIAYDSASTILFGEFARTNKSLGLI